MFTSPRIDVRTLFTVTAQCGRMRCRYFSCRQPADGVFALTAQALGQWRSEAGADRRDGELLVPLCMWHALLAGDRRVA